MGPTVKKVRKVRKVRNGGPATSGEKADGSFSWQSAISFTAQSTATLLRTVLENLKMTFRRTKSEKSYSQLYAILPFPRFAYVFRFAVTEPCAVTIDLYDTYPATSGALGFIEIPELNDGNIECAREILRELCSRLPRPPWKFTATQRIQHGILTPEIVRAKKNWRALGIAD